VSLSWPWALALLLVLPLVFVTWWLTRRRRRRATLRVTSIALVRAAAIGPGRWRRRVPAGLLAVGLAVLGIGAARPQASVPVPATTATIILALDISASMCSTDVRPNRITAAEQEASRFISSQAGGPRIGLVTFAGTAGLLVPPTKDTTQLLTALHGLTTSDGTAIGQAVMTSLDALAQVDNAVAPTGVRLVPGRGTPVDYLPDAIVVLTDGGNTQGIEPLVAAREAALRRVRVFTIGFGTSNPGNLVCAPGQFSGFGGGLPGGTSGFSGFPGGRNPLTADYATLRRVAAATGARFFQAQDAGQLKHALGSLPSSFRLLRQQHDIAASFAGLGGLLIAVAVGLSLWWSRPRKLPGPRAPGGPTP
jgi:Ca-activated chloride channel family protein